MTVYKTKVFSRFAKRSGLGNAALLEAAWAVEVGHWDADLGGGVDKQRVARDGRGKSGGFRTIILFKSGGHSFFVLGYAKSEKANISPNELNALRKLATSLLGFDAAALERASTNGEILEILTDDEVHKTSREQSPEGGA